MFSKRVNKLWPVFLVAALGLGSGVTASASEDVPTVGELKQDTRVLAEKLKNYSADQRDEAVHSINSTLKTLDRRIEQLEKQMSENWDDMSDATREETRESLETLRDQREKVGEWYTRLKDSSSGAWENMKKGFSDAYDHLSDAWRQAEDEVHSDDNDKLDQSI